MPLVQAILPLKPTSGGRQPTGGNTRDVDHERARDNSHMPSKAVTVRGRAARGRRRGFTLIELMIAVVVVGILGSLAMPAFFDAVRKSRRSDAFVALTSLQQAQERWRASNASYSDDLTALGVPTITASGHYGLSITTADTTSYTLQAVARGSQVQDKACATMALRTAAGTVQYGSACSTCTLSLPLADTARCWSRQ